MENLCEKKMRERAADDLELKNEFEPEPKTGNDCPHNAETRNVLRPQKVWRVRRTRGYAIFSDLSEKKPLKTACDP